MSGYKDLWPHELHDLWAGGTVPDSNGNPVTWNDLGWADQLHVTNNIIFGGDDEPAPKPEMTYAERQLIEQKKRDAEYERMRKEAGLETAEEIYARLEEIYARLDREILGIGGDSDMDDPYPGDY